MNLDNNEEYEGRRHMGSGRFGAIRPGFIPPMLATRVAKLPEGGEWEYEVKWDGYRIEAVKDKSMSARCPD